MAESKENIIDTEYEEYTSTRIINGKPVYFNTGQVAEQLEETESTIRYWTNCFKDFIEIKRVGRNRKFTEQNIEQLKFVKKLMKENNLTIEQTIEYCKEKDMGIIQNKIEKQDPLAIQTLASTISMQMAKQMNETLQGFKKEIIEEVVNEVNKTQESTKNNIDELKKYVAITIEEKLSNNFNEITEKMDKQEKAFIERDTKTIETLKQNMEQRKKEIEQQENKKGFLSKLFGR